MVISNVMERFQEVRGLDIVSPFYGAGSYC